MRILIIKIFIFLNIINVISALINSTRDTVNQKRLSMESSSYVLPSVNIENRTNVRTNLANVLNFYNTELLAAHWHHIVQYLTKDCAKDVGLYLVGLSKTENWALKMDDASGRYSTGWFWGNHYWTGSQSLCDNILPKDKGIIINFMNNTTSKTTREVKLSAKPSSPSQAFGYKAGPLKYTSLPPFPVGFFMVRALLNSNFTIEEKTLHIGFCMPYICTNNDIETIVKETSKLSNKISIKIEAVRSPHNHYHISEDFTFKILCAVTFMLIICILVGTLYDIYLEKMERKTKILLLHNTTHLKLDMTMPDTKTKKSSHKLYVVTNNNNNNNNNLIEETTQNLNNKCDAKKIFKFIIKESILAFSLRKNIQTICDQSVSSDTIPVLHGLKSISMAWVILGHTCITAFKYSDNMEYRKVVQKEFFFQTISNGAFSVDTFFFTSGLLVSFLYFRSNAKGKLDSLTNGHRGFSAGVAHFFGLIFYRFARLTAPYLFTLGVVAVQMKWFNYNSIFEPPTMDHINCPNYWWRNLLFINTLFPVEEMCMLWSWYLSDDTQFYVIGAVMLILSTSHFKSAAALLTTFMVSSWITTGFIAYSNKHMPGADDPLALFDKIYDKPWTRLGPYLIGMCVGWFLFKKNCKLHMSRLAVIAGWTASVSCLTSIVYGLYDVNLSPITGAVYSALSHSAWAMGLAWIVVACCTGYGGIANSLLSSTILYPFSRVTYCAYLLHPIVIRFMAMNMDSPLHLGSMVMLMIYLGQVVAAYVLSFIVSLIYEAPIVGMLRILSKIGNTKQRKVDLTT